VDIGVENTTNVNDAGYGLTYLHLPQGRASDCLLKSTTFAQALIGLRMVPVRVPQNGNFLIPLPTPLPSILARGRLSDQSAFGAA